MDHHDEEFLRKAALANAWVTQIEAAQVDGQAAACGPMRRTRKTSDVAGRLP
jgi:hypothetical protein